MKVIIFLMMLLGLSMPAFADFQQNVQSGNAYTYKFASTSTVTVVKSGAGILHNITVEGGSASTINIYDYGSANPNAQIAAFTSTNALATYTFDVNFSSGCTVTTSGAVQFTVSYL